MTKTVVALITMALFLSCKNTKKQEGPIQTEIELQSGQNLKSNLDPEAIAVYKSRGLEYALNTQSVLGKNLTQAINNDGVLGALSFCNEKAYPLTDSMAVAQNATIKRVSDRPRNQENQANTEELEHIETFKQMIANDESPTPIAIDKDSKIHIYYPILTNAACLQCHGQPHNNIEPSTLKKLNILYSEDKAIGYGVNEVRGIWSIVFDK